MRAELQSWGLGDPDIDPGTTLLKLLAQAVARAERYSAELEDMVGDSEHLRTALVEQAYGEFGPVGEYVKGMVRLEAEERDRAGNWAVKAIAAGLAERTVRVAEQQGALIADLLRAVVNDPELGLSAEQRKAMPGVARRHLAAVAG